MDAEKLKELKLYMHIDHSLDDSLIQRLWSAASEYLENCGIPQSDTHLVWLATAGLTLHWYDHPETEGTDASITLGLRNVINQLKLQYGGDVYF